MAKRLAKGKEEKMKIMRKLEKSALLLFIALTIAVSGSWAAEYNKVDHVILAKYKKWVDDPAPLNKVLPYSKVLPPDVYAKLIWDIPTMKKAWEEVVGFKAPDIVGKIAPEIKPGKYTYKDMETMPGLKELMIPYYRDHAFKPAGPPWAANFSEFTIIPTQQYFYALPVAEATKKNMGKTKLDQRGYIVDESYEGGLPFPRPSGNFKGQEILYNIVKRYFNSESDDSTGQFKGFNKNLKLDFDGLIEIKTLRLAKRVVIPPLGYLDERARARKEESAVLLSYLAPRDQAGTALQVVTFEEAKKFDAMYLYIGVLRRIRQMSTTDTQDALGGQDVIYDDNRGFSSLTPTRWPWKVEVIGEREYLVPTTTDGSIYFSSKGMELRNVEMERRPCWVVKMTQLDKNYVYGHKILYIDKETLLWYLFESYDQKGRLYRTGHEIRTFIPEMGMHAQRVVWDRDHVDLHSSVAIPFVTPIYYMGRSDVSLEGMIKKGK
jgi:hypothetical protein